MRICIDCRLINKKQNTGISRYSEFLIDYYLTRFGSENIILITNDIYFEYAGCNIFYTKLKPYNIFDYLKFEKIVNSLNIDLLHIPFYSGIYRNNSNIKIIVTVHDLMYRLVQDFFGSNQVLNRLKKFYFDFIVRNSLANADLIVSVSETTKIDLLNIFGIDSVHIPEFSSINVNEDLAILNKYNLEKDNFYFYCGNNRPHKNINFIKEIFRSNPHLPSLVLSGNNHQGCENVIVTGVVSEGELKALYKSSIAFIFPSRYEGFGLPVLESLSEGTFVIASKISAFLEFKSENIFFFELDSAREFLTAIEQSRKANFKPEFLLSQYDKKRIYQLNDKMVNSLLNL